MKIKLASLAFAVFALTIPILSSATTAFGAPVGRETAVTSDGRSIYSFTSTDAARFGGNKPSEYIANNICSPQQAVARTDNGAGGLLNLSFTGTSWDFCPAIVRVAEDWQSWHSGSWFLLRDIVIYDSDGNEIARLSM
jgi:hypothetical protein